MFVLTTNLDQNDMEKPKTSLSRDVRVTNPLGLHARPAAKLAQAAMKASGPVWLVGEAGEAVDAKSMIDILTLGCAMGTRLTISVAFPEDLSVLKHLVELVEDGFGEHRETGGRHD